VSTADRRTMQTQFVLSVVRRAPLHHNHHTNLEDCSNHARVVSQPKALCHGGLNSNSSMSTSGQPSPPTALESWAALKTQTSPPLHSTPLTSEYISSSPSSMYFRAGLPGAPPSSLGCSLDRSIATVCSAVLRVAMAACSLFVFCPQLNKSVMCLGDCFPRRF